MNFVLVRVYDNYVSAHIAKGRLEEVFHKLGLDPNARAENLTLLNYIAISNHLLLY